MHRTTRVGRTCFSQTATGWLASSSNAAFLRGLLIQRAWLLLDQAGAGAPGRAAVARAAAAAGAGPATWASSRAAGRLVITSNVTRPPPATAAPMARR